MVQHYFMLITLTQNFWLNESDSNHKALAISLFKHHSDDHYPVIITRSALRILTQMPKGFTKPTTHSNTWRIVPNYRKIGL